jgi:hypothetical protein
MKSISLKQFSVTNGTYTVTLGNGITKRFKNRKACLKFLVNCSRFLTLTLVEANAIYAELLVNYRRNWFYFDHNKNPGFALYEADRICARDIVEIQNSFNLIIERCHYTNGNHFVFAHFRTIFSTMRCIVIHLKLLQLSKSNAVDVHELQIIFKRLLSMERTLLEYNGSFTKEQIDADEIFTRNKLQIA